MVRFYYFVSTAMLCSCVLFFSGCKKHDTPKVAAPVSVSTQVINGSDAVASGSQAAYSGTVVSATESLMSFSLPGTITKIHVKEGQKVAKGQVLAQIKSENLDDNRNIAAAELEQVQDLYNRLKKLHDQNALAEVKWVEVQAKLKQAKNAVSIAERAVGDATITSPIAGYVSAKMGEEGQSVLPSEPILKIVDIDNLQIAISVPEEEINRFGRNATAEVTFDALSGLAVPGDNATKEVVANPLTRSYRVKFDIPNQNGKILPGMIGNVSVHGLDSIAGSDTGIYVLPSQSVLLSSDNRQFVWLVHEGKAAKKYVTANEFRADGVAIEAGLQPGDSVIVAGMQKVSTGTPVITTFK